MKKERLYTAKADTGRDFITFIFFSEHRAGSKANFADALKEYKSNHGHCVKILDTYLGEI